MIVYNVYCDYLVFGAIAENSKKKMEEMVTGEQLNFYEKNGYLVAKGLFQQAEVEFYIEHFMHLRQTGIYPGDTGGVDIGGLYPLKKYPRMIHMHRWDETSLKWLIDVRINGYLTSLMGREPFAVRPCSISNLPARADRPCTRTSITTGALCGERTSRPLHVEPHSSATWPAKGS